jgi:hypothetical protein
MRDKERMGDEERNLRIIVPYCGYLQLMDGGR